MPKELTHLVMAEKCRRLLADRTALKVAIDAHESLFRIGALIPDTPFYYSAGPGAKALKKSAVAFHDPAGSSYQPLIRAAKSCPADFGAKSAAFLGGVLTHILTDACFHPLIYYFSGPEAGKTRTRSMGRHRFVESVLDLHYLEQALAIGPVQVGRVPERTASLHRTTYHLAATMFGADPRKGPLWVRNAFWHHAMLQPLFQRKWPQAPLPFLQQVLPGRLDHYAALFYPGFRPYSAPFFKRPIRFRHPVTGKALEKSVQDLETQILGAFKDIVEGLPADESRTMSAILAEHAGPNLVTGMAGTRLRDMTFFDDTRDIRDLLLS